MPARATVDRISGLTLALAIVWTAGDAAAATVGVAGEGLPFATHQPSLALVPHIHVDGETDQLGRIRWLPMTQSVGVPNNMMPADGRTLQVSDHPALAERLGGAFGGDGDTFQLPDLRGRAPVGIHEPADRGQTSGARNQQLTEANLPPHRHETATGSTDPTGEAEPFDIRQPGLGLVVGIQADGAMPSVATGMADPNSIGFVSHFAGETLPAGVLPADGRTLSIAAYIPLYSFITTAYGGSGSEFSLPDTRGRLLVGAGLGPGLEERVLAGTDGAARQTMTSETMPAHSHPDPDMGLPTDHAGGDQPIPNRQPEIALTPLIAVNGVFPDDSIAVDADSAIVGEVAWFAGNYVPPGWAIADGSLLSMAQNTPLFAQLLLAFGGDGQGAFALPDLRGRTLVGASTDSPLGSAFGSDWLGLTAANLPPHDHAIDRARAPGVIPLPGALPLMLGALALLGGLAVRRGMG